MKRPILVVEDDNEIRQSVVEILTDEGYFILEAENGKAALEVLGKTDSLPGLIILDIMMPVLNGFEFRQKQLEVPALADIPTVFLSADAQLKQKAAAAGVSESIRKPIDLDELFNVAKKYCG